MSEFLADVNVVIALIHEDHEQYHRAHAWFDEIDRSDAIAICRVVQMDALRLLTRPAVMREAVLDGRAAWSALSKLMDDDRIAYSAEPNGFEAGWQKICESVPRGTSAQTDAYLAAFALAAGASLVTFDGGMLRFTGLRVVIP